MSAAAPPAPQPSRAAHLGRIALALALGVLLCEALLQGLALAGGDARRLTGLEVGDARTIVCVGDSNTYGVQMEPEDTYPSLLESLLNAADPGRPWRVLNLGVPGYATRQVADLVPRALERHRPEALLVLAGVNDRWRRDDPADAPSWLEGLRTARLLRLLAARFGALAEPVDLAADGRPRLEEDGAAPAELEIRREGLGARMAGNLEVVRDVCGDAGVPLVLLTYAADRRAYGEVNEVLRGLAPELGVPLVDCGRALEAAREAWPRDALYLDDDHPRALGYEHFARAVLAGLHREGLVDGDVEAALGRPLATEGLPGASFELRRTGEGLLLEVRGAEPGRRFVVVASGPDGEPAELGGRTLPLARDAFFLESLRRPELSGTFDADGSASVLLRAEPGAPLADLRVVVCVLDRGGESRVRRHSAPLMLPAD